MVVEQALYSMLANAAPVPCLPCAKLNDSLGTRVPATGIISHPGPDHQFVRLSSTMSAMRQPVLLM